MGCHFGECSNSDYEDLDTEDTASSTTDNDDDDDDVDNW